MNVALAYRVLAHIEANPAQYSHETEIAWIDPAGYHVEPAGGTLVADFTGWTCLLSGDTPEMSHGGKAWSGAVITADGSRQDCEERAVTLLGLDTDGEAGVFSYEDVDTLDKLRAAVAEAFGPRPGGDR